MQKLKTYQLVNHHELLNDEISLKNKNLQIRLTNEFCGLSETTEKSYQKQ